MPNYADSPTTTDWLPTSAVNSTEFTGPALNLAAKPWLIAITQSYINYYVRTTEGRNHLQVTVERPGKKPWIAKCGEKPLKYCSNATFAHDIISPFTILERKRELTKRLLANKCECCSTTDSALEAHHVNKLANLKHRWQGRKEKPDWVKWMISRHRKTIFVCRPCHTNITFGRYDGARLR